MKSPLTRGGLLSIVPRRSIAAVLVSALRDLPLGDFVQFPDLESFRYELAAKPAGAILRAWAKLQETERRLVVFRWVAEATDPAQPQHRTYLDDCESAFLMAFEATLQIVHDERKQRDLESWLQTCLAGFPNDLVFRAIRTLRHLEAHVRAESPHSLIVVSASSPRITRHWQLPTLTADDLRKLRSPRIEVSELSEWNQLASRNPAAELMNQALAQLAVVVQRAEEELATDSTPERAGG